jgi:OPT oligopeptide transporter protein
LWYGKEIINHAKAAIRQIDSKKGLKDLHNQLMNAYSDVPEWGYAAWLLVFSVLSVIVTQVTPFYMPAGVTCLAILMGAITTIPFGLVQAVSGTFFYLQVISQFLIGYIMPGNPGGVACFTSLSSNIVYQALLLTADLKLGHYMHIDPYAMVACQLIGTLIGILINTGGAFVILDLVSTPEIFVDPQWKGTNYTTFLNSAGIWGGLNV